LVSVFFTTGEWGCRKNSPAIVFNARACVQNTKDSKCLCSFSLEINHAICNC